jgi:hypothetical protein
MKRRIMAALIGGMLATSMLGGTVAARITPVDTECTTPNGNNAPPGQQPTCRGGGLEQETENQNPAGKAPPGQNK